MTNKHTIKFWALPVLVIGIMGMPLKAEALWVFLGKSDIEIQINAMHMELNTSGFAPWQIPYSLNLYRQTVSLDTNGFVSAHGPWTLIATDNYTNYEWTNIAYTGITEIDDYNPPLNGYHRYLMAGYAFDWWRWRWCVFFSFTDHLNLERSLVGIVDTANGPLGGATITLKPEAYGYGLYDRVTTSGVDGGFSFTNFPRYIYSSGAYPKWVNWSVKVSTNGTLITTVDGNIFTFEQENVLFIDIP